MKQQYIVKPVYPITDDQNVIFAYHINQALRLGYTITVNDYNKHRFVEIVISGESPTDRYLLIPNNWVTPVPIVPLSVDGLYKELDKVPFLLGNTVGEGLKTQEEWEKHIIKESHQNRDKLYEPLIDLIVDFLKENQSMEETVDFLDNLSNKIDDINEGS